MKNTSLVYISDSDSYLQYVHRFYFRYKEGVAGGRGESVGTNSGYTHQIAEIQHKQRKTKRHASVSSDNFSSSRSDSWRHGGRHCIQGMYRVKTLYEVNYDYRKYNFQTNRYLTLILGLQHGPGHHYRHRRRNSWTVTRKPSQVSLNTLCLLP